MACWPGGAAADTPSIAKHPCGAGKEEEVKASKTEIFLDSASSSTNNGGPSAKERGSLNQSYPPFPPFSTSLPTSSSIILSKGVEPSVKERGPLDSVFADVCLRNQTRGKRGIWRKMGAGFGLLSNWGTRGGTRGDLREWL